MSMFDVPLATANAIYNLANVVLIFGAVLVTVGTIAAIWSGGIRGMYADERISQNEINTASANEAAANANEHAALLAKEAEQARLETEQLRQQMAWRRLSEDQIRNIAGGLAGLAIPLRMAAIANDPESMLFALDIRRALLAAGIETPINSVVIGGAVPIGIIIKGPKDHALRVGNAFVAAGLNVRVKEQGGDLEILVGSKPPPQ